MSLNFPNDRQRYNYFFLEGARQQALAFENHAESIFEKAAFVYKFFGDTNRINIDKLTKRFNSELRLMVQQIYNSFESSHANSFDEWMNNLLDTVIENIVEFSPQLYNQAEIIREETERIAELESRKLKLREYSEQIRRMMDAMFEIPSEKVKSFTVTLEYTKQQLDKSETAEVVPDRSADGNL